MNIEKPQAVREGKHIKHYTYRGIRIDRWVNDRGYNKGNTTLYVTAGTKFSIDIIFKDGSREHHTMSSLADTTQYINRKLDGFKMFGGSTIFYRAENGKLVFDHAE